MTASTDQRRRARAATHENQGEQAYLRLLREVYQHGDRREGRNGLTRSLFGRQLRFENVADSFPLLTTKRVPFRLVALELLWFLRGDTNAKWLEDLDVEIWREWGDPETREMGPIYGSQWRRWEGRVQASYGRHPLDDEPNLVTFTPLIDQIAQVIHSLLTEPFSRRHVVSAWNPADLDEMALPPCHALFQFHVDGQRRLSCHLYQRSADIFLGLPFNIASYALLTAMVAHVTDLFVGDLIISLGDVHMYENHRDQVEEQLGRLPRRLPTLAFDRPPDGIDGWELSNFLVGDYNPWPAIKAPVSA